MRCDAEVGYVMGKGWECLQVLICVEDLDFDARNDQTRECKE